MSKTIDQRVVEMRFDNKQFEQNVSTTMSTLEKLKAKLNLTGASKGLENVSAAAKNFHMGGMSSAIDTVTARFSALDVMGVTALANLTNSAVNAGKKIVNALTIEPVHTGYKEYELKLDSVKTIMASTGESVETVNKYLEELNKYSDETIYSFADMTQNIGKFTNAGVKLEDAVMAIKGISNEAAVSGANANEASRAMYNFAQALSAGYVKLIDWKSIELANMATVEFKTQLLEAAVAAGTLTKSSDGMYTTLKGNTLSATKDFNETLNDQWMTTEVLVNTLKDYADETTAIGAKAKEAATKVSKFTQMIDVLKETAQSGWAKTWELIFGDIEVARSIFTPLTDFLSGIINKMSDFRNGILEGALSSPFAKLASKISNAADSTSELATKVKDLNNIANEVMKGVLGDGPERWNKLTEAGYDWAAVQNLVNERMGDSTRHTEQAKDAQEELQKTQGNTIEQLVAMSDAELKALNFTESEVEALRELEKQAKETGKPLSELLESMDKVDGRTLLIESFKNAGQGLVAVFTAIKNAWADAFPPMTSEQLYNIIDAIHSFSEKLRVGEETAAKLERTFKGLFAAIDIITTVTGGALKMGLKAVAQLFGKVDVNILDFTANLGDAIVAVRDWIDANNIFAKGLDVITPYLHEVTKAVREWIDEIKGSEDIPGAIISGLANGLKAGVKMVADVIKELANGIIETFCEIMGIHSPSRTMFELATQCILGLSNGIVEGIKLVVGSIGKLGSSIVDAFNKVDFSGLTATITKVKNAVVEVFKNIDWGTLIAVGLTSGMLYTAGKVASAIEKLASPLEGFGDVIQSTSKVLKSASTAIKSHALLTMAKAIAILAGSIAVLALIDKGDGKIQDAVAIINGLMIALIALSAAVGKWGPKDAIELGKFSLALVGLSSSLLIIAGAIKLVSGIQEDDLSRAVGAVVALGALMIALIASTNLFNKDATNVGSTLLGMSAAMVLMLYVVKQAAELDERQIKNGVTAVAIFSGLLLAVIAATKLFGNDSAHVGGTLLKIAATFALMIIVTKLAAGMSMADLVKGGTVIAAFAGLIALMIIVADLAGKREVKALGKCLIGMAAAMLVMALVIKMVGGMDAGSLLKGVLVVGALALFIGGLIAATSLVTGESLKGVAGTLLAASVAIGILGVITALLGMLPIANLAKGIVAVGLLTAMMSLMMWSMKGVNDIKGNLIVLTVAIALLAAAVAALSFIDISKLAASTLALSTLMGMFAVLAKASSNITTSIKSILILTVVVGLIGGLLFLLGKLEVNESLGTAAALSMLLLAISASVKILDSANSVSLSAMAAVVVLTILVAALAGILSQMKDLPVESTMANATALSMLLLSLSASLAILAVVGSFGPAALTGMGIFAAFVAELAILIGGIGALVNEFPILETFIDKGVPILDKLANAFGSFFGNIVSGFIEGATTGALPTMGQHLSDFMSNAEGFFTGIQNINESTIAGVKSLAEMLIVLTGANFLDGIAQWFTGGRSIADFAKQLVPFGEAVSDFSKAVAGKVNVTSVEAASSAGKMLAELAKAIPNSGGLSGLFAGNNDIDAFANKLVPFGEAIAAFSGTVAGKVNKPAVEAATYAGELIANMANAIPNAGGLSGLFAGNNDIDTWSGKLVPFGEAIVAFSSTVAGKVSKPAVEAAAYAGGLMSELANSLPNGVGIASAFTGLKDIEMFGWQLESFGTSIAKFSAAVAGKVSKPAVEAAAYAGSAMAELANSLPPGVGLFSMFTGVQDIQMFGWQLVSFGESIAKFSNSVKDINTAAIYTSVTAARSLAQLANELPSSGGIWSIFSADNDMSTFGNELKEFGKAMEKYGESVADVDLSTINNSANAARRIMTLIKDLVGIDTSGVAAFKTAVNELGKISVNDIVSAFNSATAELTNVGTGMIDAVIGGVTLRLPVLTSSIQTLITNMTSELSTRKGELETSGIAMIESFVKGFNSKRKDAENYLREMLVNMKLGIMDSIPTFFTSGVALMTGFNKGLSEASENIETIITQVMFSAVSGIKDYYSSFYDAGGYLVDGFCAGIGANTFKAEAKAAAMARKAAEAAEEELDINSPSKRFYGIGDFAGQGFVNALSDYAMKAYSAGSEMARSASDGLTKAISKVSDLIGMEIDAQPTISPVLDLSNVRSGMNTLNGMLGVGSSVGVLANVGTIGSMMNGYSQNGTNDDIVSAINKLRSELGNVGGPSYSIGNISYEKGTEVADAIETLVRAAKMEGRV